MYPFNIYIYQYVIYNILKQCIYSSEVIFTSSPDFGAIIPFYFSYSDRCKVRCKDDRFKDILTGAK